MSKCGMIVRDQKTNKMKVKLYAEPNGQLKGDGLCHYIKVSTRRTQFHTIFAFRLWYQHSWLLSCAWPVSTSVRISTTVSRAQSLRKYT